MLQTVPQTNSRPFLIHARVDLCAIKKASKLLGKKWNLVIVHRLMDKKMGFNDLKEAVGDVSAKILSQSLQDLQAHGLVDRRVASESPIRVEYSLTQKGHDLEGVLNQLQGWGKRWDICREDQEAAPNVTLRHPATGVHAEEPTRTESAA